MNLFYLNFFLGSAKIAYAGKDLLNFADFQAIDVKNQEWGYIPVRQDANMFWWLYYTTADVPGFASRPLIIWLQGPPSNCPGNFFGIGPTYQNFSKNAHTWVKHFNILFIEYPVTSGFSYFSSTSAKMVENDGEMVQELVNFTELFLKKKQEFKTIPIYIFGEFVSGRTAVDVAYELHNKIKYGKMQAQLKGIGLGNAWISPIDYILNYASLAFHLGLVDSKGFDDIDQLAKQLQKAFNNKDSKIVSDIETKMDDYLSQIRKGILMWNIALRSNADIISRATKDSCNTLMNTRIKKVLNIPNNVTWNSRSFDSFYSFENFLRPVTSSIEEMLNETDIKIIVYNGVLDFEVNTAGTTIWLDNLKWKSSSEWQQAQMTSLEIGNMTEAYTKQVGNLVFYTVMRSGALVQIFNPEAMQEILKRELLNVVVDYNLQRKQVIKTVTQKNYTNSYSRTFFEK